MNGLTPVALEGIRIIDVTDISCVYATKILCDLGAEVIRVESPEGDPMRRLAPIDDQSGESYFHVFMNVNKKSVTLDFSTPIGRERFRRLVKSADIVVESLPPGHLAELGLDYDSLESESPALVWVSVTPFGSAGPRADWLADDLVAQAIGGLMNLNGLPGRAPLRLFGEQSNYIAGLHAAAGALMAFWSAQETGIGQLVDTSVQECIAHTLENAIQMYTTEGTVRQRTKGRVDPGSGVFECSDGEVYLTAGLSMISSSWHNMVALLTREGVEGADDLADPKWTDQTWRQTPEAQQIASSVISRFTRTRTKNQVYDITQQHNILSAPMNKVSDVFDNAQLKFLGWFQEQLWDDRPVVWPGSPIRMSETPRRTPLLVSAAGHDTDAVFSSLNGDVVASVNDPKEA